MDSESTFFTGTKRRVLIGSPTLQGATRRICVPIRMPLSGESLIGMPDWLGEAYTAVSRFASEMTPEIEQIADITLAFANSKPADALFEVPAAKVPQAELRAFNVERTGDAEEPEVELKFKAYTPFMRDFWSWLGEMAGKEAYMAFPSSLGNAVVTVKPGEGQMSLPDSEATEEETAILASDSKPEDGPGSKQFEDEVRQSIGAPEPLSEAPRLARHDDPEPGFKNGEDLAAYHERKTEEENSKKRRRSLAGVN
jgi:hypothetical protein